MIKLITKLIIALALITPLRAYAQPTGQDISNTCGLATACGAMIAALTASGSLTPSADNTYDVGSATFGYRSGYFDTSVLTPLLIPPGDLVVRVDADAQRLHTIGASSDTALQYIFGDGGTTAVQQLTISSGSSDSDDDTSLILAGGGASGGTRGSSITLAGEEVAGGGDITYNTGASDTHIFQVGGTTEVTFLDDEILIEGTAGTVGSNGSVAIKVDADANRIWTFDASSDTVLTTVFGDNGTTTQTYSIVAASSDASDDEVFCASGGGGTCGSITRGSYLTLDGADSGGAGLGDAVLAGVRFTDLVTGNGGGSVGLRVNDTSNVSIPAGNLTVLNGITSTQGGFVAATSGQTLSLQEATAGAKCMGGVTANGVTAVTVSTTCVGSDDRIFITRTSAIAAGVTEPGCWATNIVNNTSFDFDCNDAAEDSTFNWIIFKEAA